MMNKQLLNRSGLAAIAAATAFLSTPALGQEAAPITVDPAPIVADEALPAEPATVPTPEPATTPEVAGDPLAPATSATATTTRPTRAAPGPAARGPATTTRSASPIEPAPVASAPAPAPIADIPADPVMVAPLPEPVAAEPVAPTGDNGFANDLIPIAGAAGLGILALAGAGFAMRRRRRTDEDALVEENWHEPAMSRPAPVPQKAVVAAPVAATPVASAFNWDSAPKQVADTAPANRIEAAKRGPTPDNPSLSLKKRLKRAAFFDQRDRLIAAGKGTPVSATAGLPDAMTPVPATPSEPVRQPRPVTSMSFGRTFQPA